jgi:hypothetical protein
MTEMVVPLTCVRIVFWMPIFWPPSMGAIGMGAAKRVEVARRESRKIFFMGGPSFFQKA